MPDIALLKSLELSLQESCSTLSLIARMMLLDDAIATKLEQMLISPSVYSHKNASSIMHKWTPKETLSISSNARSAYNLLNTSNNLTSFNESQINMLPTILNELENCIGIHMREKNRSQINGLYVIIDPQVTSGKAPIDIAKETLMGGAKILQLRDKQSDKGEILSLAKTLQYLCDETDALLIINDHADLAVTVNSNGIHVGQQDLPIKEARMILLPHQLIGKSTTKTEEALEAELDGADYIAVGSIYHSQTKKDSVLAGLKPLQETREKVSIPIVAIGGISENRVHEVAQSGADAICVTSAVSLAKSPLDATKRLVEKFHRGKEDI